MRASTLIIIFFLLHNGCKHADIKNTEPKKIIIDKYVFDFNTDFTQQIDSNSVSAGWIVGEDGIQVRYSGGWIPFMQSKITEDTSTVFARIDTIDNLFRKVVYSKDSSQGEMLLILCELEDLRDTSGSIFPNTFMGLTMEASKINREQQNELLKIFQSGRLNKK